MPARMRDKAEAIARGRCRPDAPARCRRTCFRHLGRPQQEERPRRIGGSELQPLTCFQIELIDRAGDSGYRVRTQRLFHRPQRILAMRGLDQNQTVRIEPERVESMTVRPAVIAQAVSWKDQDERSA